MEEKYILIKPYTCAYGTLAEGSEIIPFRGAFYFNGGAVPHTFDKIMSKLVNDPEYTKRVKIIKNEF